MTGQFIHHPYIGWSPWESCTPVLAGRGQLHPARALLRPRSCSIEYYSDQVFGDEIWRPPNIGALIYCSFYYSNILTDEVFFLACKVHDVGDTMCRSRTIPFISYGTLTVQLPVSTKWCYFSYEYLMR